MKNDTEENVKVNGYQLIKLVSDPIRDQFDINWESLLRSSPIGTMVGVQFDNAVYFGTTVSPYVGERVILISFVIPLNTDGLFRFPITRTEIDQMTEHVHVEQIVRVGVEYRHSDRAGEYSIVISQFGGRVVS